MRFRPLHNEGMQPRPVGKHNPRLAEIRKALRSGALTSDGCLPIEGRRMVEEARRSGLRVRELYRAAGSGGDALADAAGAAPTFAVTESVLRSISATDEPQGLLALVEPPAFDLDDTLGAGEALVIVLCGLQDPGNAGTIVRLGEAFGATGCIATAGTVGRFNAKLVRATAGSLFRLPHVWDLELSRLVEWIRSVGLRAVGAAADGTRDIESEAWTAPTAVLIGNEGAGLDPAGRAACDTIVRIPHSDRVESLNASAASAIVLYEAYLRRRRQRA